MVREIEADLRRNLLIGDLTIPVGGIGGYVVFSEKGFGYFNVGNKFSGFIKKDFKSFVGEGKGFGSIKVFVPRVYFVSIQIKEDIFLCSIYIKRHKSNSYLLSVDVYVFNGGSDAKIICKQNFGMEVSGYGCEVKSLKGNNTFVLSLSDSEKTEKYFYNFEKALFEEY